MALNNEHNNVLLNLEGMEKRGEESVLVESNLEVWEDATVVMKAGFPGCAFKIPGLILNTTIARTEQCSDKQTNKLTK